MINVNAYNKNDDVWFVSQEIEKMLEPKKIKFFSKESETGTKLAFVIINEKRVCVPTNLLFNSKIDAEVFAAINFIKLYYSFDPFTISDDVSEENLNTAHKMIEFYEEKDPAKFLYYWMGNVPNR